MVKSSLISCCANTAVVKHPELLNSEVVLTTRDENNSSDLTCVVLFPSKLAGSILPKRHWSRENKAMTMPGQVKRTGMASAVLLNA